MIDFIKYLLAIFFKVKISILCSHYVCYIFFVCKRLNSSFNHQINICKNILMNFKFIMVYLFLPLTEPPLIKTFSPFSQIE